MQTEHTQQAVVQFRPWNKGKLVGPKPPFKRKEIWAIRIRLQLAGRTRDLALFNLAIDSKLRGCDLVSFRVGDVAQGGHVVARGAVVQRKTSQPVRFELTEQTREAVAAWIGAAHLRSEQFLFPSRLSASPHLSTRQYSRLVKGWAALIGLDPEDYGTHTLRRTKTTLNLPTDQEPSRCPVAPGTQHVGKHRPLPRNRGRRRLGDS